MGVPGEKKKVKIVERGKKKSGEEQQGQKKKKKTQVDYSGHVGDLQVSEIYLIPYQGGGSGRLPNTYRVI